MCAIKRRKSRCRLCTWLGDWARRNRCGEGKAKVTCDKRGEGGYWGTEGIGKRGGCGRSGEDQQKKVCLKMKH